MDSSHHLVGDQQHAVQGERSPNDEVADQLRLQGDVQDPIAALGSLSVMKKNRTGKYIFFPKKKFETQNASTKKKQRNEIPSWDFDTVQEKARQHPPAARDGGGSPSPE